MLDGEAVLERIDFGDVKLTCRRVDGDGDRIFEGNAGESLEYIVIYGDEIFVTAKNGRIEVGRVVAHMVVCAASHRKDKTRKRNMYINKCEKWGKSKKNICENSAVCTFDVVRLRPKK